MNDLENIPIFVSVASDNQISLLLYGNDRFDDTKNQKILMPLIKFSKDSQSYDGQLSDNLPV